MSRGGARRCVVCLGGLGGTLCLSGGWEVRCVSWGTRRYVVCLRGLGGTLCVSGGGGGGG